MIIIDAKRWFDKINGNTYHSVRVFKDSKELGYIPFQYGYGESYLQTAHEILAKNGIFDYERTKELVPVYKRINQRERSTTEIDYHTPKESINKIKAYEEFTQDMRENCDNYHITVNDVQRKKDL